MHIARYALCSKQKLCEPGRICVGVKCSLLVRRYKQRRMRLRMEKMTPSLEREEDVDENERKKKLWVEEHFRRIQLKF